jgi:hypothetical protein
MQINVLISKFKLTSLRHSVVTQQISMQVLHNVYSKFIDKFTTQHHYHITDWSALTILHNVSGTSSEVQEPVQVHHLTILIFKDLLNQ